MEIIQLQSDKMSITIFVSVAVALITALMTIVKLVNDKEAKISDYRQSWADSVRKSLANLIANINSLAESLRRTTNKAMLVVKVTKKIKERRTEDPGTDVSDLLDNKKHLIEQLAADKEIVRNLKSDLQHSYAESLLHFKHRDEWFIKIDKCMDEVFELLRRYSSTPNTEKDLRLKMLERMQLLSEELALYSQETLKDVWESVKKGEPVYQKTKRWSIRVSALMFLLLLVVGVGSFGWPHSANVNQGSGIPQACSALPMVSQVVNLDLGKQNREVGNKAAYIVPVKKECD